MGEHVGGPGKIKTCSKCGLRKNLPSDFYRVQATGRFLSWCKSCSKAAAKEQRKANPAYYHRKAKEWKARNPHKVNESGRKCYDKLKREVLEIAGGVCWCCGSAKDPQLDHIVPALWGSKTKQQAASIQFRELRNNPELLGAKYQILCRDCNNWKRDGPACPCSWWDKHFPGWRENACR